MRIQRTTNGWSCLIASVATVLQVSVSTLVKDVGHDGSDIVFPGLIEPFCRRSFHIQEMMDCCELREFSLVGFEALPVSAASGYFYELPIQDPEARIKRLMKNRVGVLTGRNLQGLRHAVAWDGQLILDPATGERYSLDYFNLEVFWRLQSNHF